MDYLLYFDENIDAGHDRAPRIARLWKHFSSMGSGPAALMSLAD
jgi:hypothetical protein